MSWSTWGSSKPSKNAKPACETKQAKQPPEQNAKSATSSSKNPSKQNPFVRKKQKPVAKRAKIEGIVYPTGGLNYFDNQLATIEHLLRWPSTYDASDPGTGKTGSELGAWASRYAKDGRCLLILAPKSVMQTAWGDDIDKFFPGEFMYSVARAENREAAFKADADIYITNLDAAKWLAQQKKGFFDKFDELVIDEATAYKNPQSQRSKAVGKIAPYFDFRRELSGTPMPKSVLDLWFQMYILDGGQRLGDSYYRFRNQMCDAVQVGPRPEHRQWTDKENAEIITAALVNDITIRHRFEDCHDIPPNVQRKLYYDMAPKHRKLYDKMKEEAMLETTDGGLVVATNPAVLANKLVQIASGSVYTNTGAKSQLFNERVELVIELVKERQHSIVFFWWEHQRDALKREAEKEGIDYEVIDGTVDDRRRVEIIRAFQEGRYQTLFLQPESTAHGITLTRATASIWASPTYRPDIMRQGLARVYRAGQDKLTENIMICARNTADERVYEVMAGKNTRMENMLEFLE